MSVKFSYGDRRVSSICRAAGLAYLESLDGIIKQHGRDVFVNGTNAFRVKTSNTAHLVGEQMFWGAIKPAHHKQFLKLAKRLEVSPIYALIAPDSARLSREELAKGNEQPIPSTAQCWNIPGETMSDFLVGKRTTKAGLTHMWIVKHGNRHLLAGDGYPDPATGVDITACHHTFSISDSVKEFVAGGGGVFVGKDAPGTNRTAPASLSTLLGLRLPIPRVEVDLLVGVFRITGTLTVGRR